MQSKMMPIHTFAEEPDADMIPMGPTSPQVPIPADTPVHSSLNTSVESGPQIAEASVGGIQI